MKKRIFISAMIAVMLFTLSACGLPIDKFITLPQTEEPSSQLITEGNAAVHFLDIGQGDSIFIELNGQTILIDAGVSDSDEVIIPYIEALGYSKIDHVVATHPHADHIGSMDKVIEYFEIGAVYAPRAVSTSKTFERFLTAVSDKGLKITTATEGKQITEGVTILSPEEGQDLDDLNDASAIILLSLGEVDMLFTGDAGASVIDACDVDDIEVLKVGHHGSYTSTDEALVTKLSPEYAVISCGEDNSYGHPHKEVLGYLEGVETYRTDIDGTVVCRTDGTNTEWECEND